MNLDTDEKLKRIDIEISKNLHAINTTNILSLSIQLLLFWENECDQIWILSLTSVNYGFDQMV